MVKRKKILSRSLFAQGLIRAPLSRTELVDVSSLLLEAHMVASGSEHPTGVGAAGKRNGALIALSHNRIADGLFHRADRLYRANWPDYDIHGEAYGIFNCARFGIKTKSSEFAITEPCCQACATLLVRSGVAKIIYSLSSIDHRTAWHPLSPDDTEKQHEDISTVEALRIFKENSIPVVAVAQDRVFSDRINVARTSQQRKNIIDHICPELRRKDRVPFPDRMKANNASNPLWTDYKIIRSLLRCAREGLATNNCGVIVSDELECRQANAIVISGIKHVIIRNSGLEVSGDLQLSRYREREPSSTPHEREVARLILREAGVVIDRVEGDSELVLRRKKYLVADQTDPHSKSRLFIKATNVGAYLMVPTRKEGSLSQTPKRFDGQRI